jgi:hypothetical protein
LLKVLEIAIDSADWCAFYCQSWFASGRSFAASLWGAEGSFYDAVYFVCSCGVLAFGHGDRPGQRVSGRDASCVQLQRRRSFQLPLRLAFVTRPGSPKVDPAISMFLTLPSTAKLYRSRRVAGSQAGSPSTASDIERMGNDRSSVLDAVLQHLALGRVRVLADPPRP